MIMTRGSISPFLCVKASGIYVGLQPLFLSSASSIYPSYFMCSQIQRVSLPVNLRCDKACNLIVALFPLLTNIYSPVPEDYIPWPDNPIRFPWET